MQWVWEATAKIADAPLYSEPWRHIRVSDVFPAGTYAEMLSQLPERALMRPLSYMTQNRHVLNIHGRDRAAHVPEFWETFADKLFPSLRCTLEAALGVRGGQEGGAVVYDEPGYELPVHTDTPDRLITAVFYLPADLSVQHQGTVLLRGREPDPDGMAQPFGDGFRVDKVVPYAPNAALIFERTDWTYHAVMRTDAPRWTLSFDVFR